MHMILSLDTPSSGSVLVNGKPYGGLTDPLRAVGALLDAKGRRRWPQRRQPSQVAGTSGRLDPQSAAGLIAGSALGVFQPHHSTPTTTT